MSAYLSNTIECKRGKRRNERKGKGRQRMRSGEWSEEEEGAGREGIQGRRGEEKKRRATYKPP